MFPYDATGYVDDQKKGFEKKLLPKGNYNFEIVEFIAKDGRVYPLEGKTKDGKFAKVDVLCEVTTEGEFKGERLFHSVTFKPIKQEDGTPTPGAGMAIHFLKTIGQPWENKFSIDPTQWVGAEFKGYVIQDEYLGKKGNKIKQVEPITATKDDSLPF
jgi:hypothetical protein